jgi:hypothetical protein
VVALEHVVVDLHGKQEIQLTHGFFLFPSVRALTLVMLSGGEFSSVIGNTTGEAPAKDVGARAAFCATF